MIHQLNTYLINKLSNNIKDPEKFWTSTRGTIGTALYTKYLFSLRFLTVFLPYCFSFTFSIIYLLKKNAVETFFTVFWTVYFIQ